MHLSPTHDRRDENFKMDRISPSMISLYLSCPLAFYYGYVAKIQLPQKQIHLLFGSAVHSGIEHMHKGDKDPSLAFEEIFLKEKLSPEEQADHAQYWLMGKEMLKNFTEQYPMFDKLYEIGKVSSEQRIRRKLIHPITGEESSVPLSGILDGLSETQKIQEYKTSKGKWSTDETRFKVQSLLYNLWYYSEYGKIAEETLYFVLLKKFKKSKTDQTVQVIRYTPTIDELAGAFEEVELILQKIKAGIFDRPQGSYHPKYCDCYKYEKALELQQ